MNEAPCILLTGFGPFHDVVDNPSQRVAEQLDGSIFDGARVQAAVLDVSFERSVAQLRALITSSPPKLMVHLGVARTATEIRLETTAANSIDSQTPDVDGQHHEGVPVCDDMSFGTTLQTSVSLSPLASRLCEAGFPTTLSHHAGRYVCNALYFNALRLAQKGPWACAFVHLPQPGTRPDNLRADQPAWSVPRLYDATHRLIEDLSRTVGR